MYNLDPASMCYANSRNEWIKLLLPKQYNDIQYTAQYTRPGTPLLTWINFISNMDK